ncbi:MAG: tetratricopeptide repeat protein [Nostoc sp. ZfuVER08]|uniref:Tetratricopeptide repeat protein n=1 Tax=Nostoc punctiforme FACHB-252 TaxID=1357509 RepID=A0ABR8H7Y3_NOSPU|nr:tetratricopeptide repeat protein [Nostoc punctiforme]MBD2611853.1 tetratricopeptide repeat protein [Nostoc punctiforme FACHB-252]MBL1198139.1 tetratricopeptide repeat protein [Nostoc sp. GBBB01]MDZ8015848.1 tetratricopeptide repeat protein [Nostoc sp. ZfuVER08]
MSRFYRFMLNFGIAFALMCIFIASPGYSLPISITEITAGDFFNLGIEKMQHDSYVEAIENFTEAIKLKNDFASAYNHRCLVYLRLKDYQNAIADCNQALNFTPNNVEAHLNRGLAYYRQRNYQAAIADYNQAIALKPDDFRAYYNRGVADAMLGHRLQAISDYEQALSNIPETSSTLKADIYNDRGIARFELLDLKAAMLDFSKAIALSPNDYRAYYNRACACARSGDRSCAVRDFTDSLKLNPTNAQAYLNRGMAYHQLGREPAAIADLRKALEYFAQQGETTTYELTLILLKSLQQQLSSLSEIA